MPTNASKYLNGGRLELEGSFDLAANAAVNTIAQPDGSTKTCRGEFMTTAKTGTGQYDVTVKLASATSGSPIFQPLEVVGGGANLFGAATATAVSARVASVTTDTSGNLVIRILTLNSAGAAADTTGAITVCFEQTLITTRQGGVM